jgi:hypothetical protein
MRSRFMFSLVGLAAVAAVGCAAKTTAPPGPTAISGSAALSTFPKGATGVAATDEAGHTSSVALASDGRFTLSLPKGHTYKLAFMTGTGAVPLVFPRHTGKLDASFNLKTDGAAVRLGTVHYLAAAPAAGFKVLASMPTQATQQGGDCVDCVNDDQQTTCEKSDGTDDGEAKSSEGEAKKAPESSSGTGETDNAEQADPNQEMAVGDQNAPDQVDGCGGGDGQNGDNVEQTGEH